MRLVADAARRVQPHDARAEEGLEIRREVARGAVIARHDERGLVGTRVEQRGQQVGPQAGAYEGTLAAVRATRRGMGELPDLGVLVRVGEELAERALDSRKG